MADNGYKGTTYLASGITPANGQTFPLATAHDVHVYWYGENERLDTVLSSLSSGGGSIDPGVLSGFVPLSAVKQTVTSSSTSAEIASAKAVWGSVSALQEFSGYDVLTAWDSSLSGDQTKIPTISTVYGAIKSIVPSEEGFASKADKVAGATAGNLAGLNADGNLTDSGVAVSAVAPMQEVTYAELVSLRTAGRLIPGRQYRITDYVATARSNSNAQSANKPFDVIVTADSVNKLNEVARAIQNGSDTYFANNRLEAWKIWYSLDNDMIRFDWADEANGKGVVYRMIDEYNNDFPYDFKGLKIKPRDRNDYFYTFSLGYDDDEYRQWNTDDWSLYGRAKAYNNICAPLFEIYSGNTSKPVIPQIVFLGGGGAFNNTFAPGSRGITISGYTANCHYYLRNRREISV